MDRHPDGAAPGVGSAPAAVPGGRSDESHPLLATDRLPSDALVDAVERLVVAGVGLTALSRLTDAGGDLSLPQWRVLTLLGLGPDGSTLSDLSSALGVSLPATSRQLRRLAWRGLVVLEPDARDRRAMRARLTAVGWSLRAAVFAERRRRIVAGLALVETSAASADALAAIAGALEEVAGQPRYRSEREGGGRPARPGRAGRP